MDDYSLLPSAEHIIPVKAEREGYISSIDTYKVGLSSQLIGAGMSKKEDNIDAAVGLVMYKRLGDQVQKGDILAEFHVNDLNKFDEASKIFMEAIQIRSARSKLRPLVLGLVTKHGIQKFGAVSDMEG